MVWQHSHMMAGFTQLFAGRWHGGTAAVPFESGGIEGDSGPASKGTPREHLVWNSRARKQHHPPPLLPLPFRYIQPKIYI